MGVDYVIHIFDSPEYPLEMDDLLVSRHLHFFAEYREVLNRYTTKELANDLAKLEDARADFDKLEEKSKQAEQDYLKRWLTPDGKYLPDPWYEDMFVKMQGKPYVWDAWSLAYHRICATPQFNFGSDDGGYKSEAVVLIEAAFSHDLTLIDDNLIAAFESTGSTLDVEDWQQDSPLSLRDFLIRHKSQHGFVITH